MRGRLAWLRTPRNQYASLFFGTLILYLLTASYTGQNSDTASAFTPAWQFVHSGNVTMDQFTGRGLWLVEVDGRLVSNRFPGIIWLAVPFYLLDSADAPNPVMANLAAAVVTAGALVILLVLLRRVVSGRQAGLAVLIVGFGTSVWTVSGDSLWTHGPGQLFLLLAVLLLASGRPWTAALAFAAAITLRPHYAVIPIAWGLLEMRSRREVGIGLKLALGVALGVSVVIAYNLNVFGAWVAQGYEYGAIDADARGGLQFLERVAGTLVSPARGIFVLTPLLLLLLPGISCAWRAAPGWVRSAALSGTAYMLVQLALNRYSGGSNFFSYRLSIEWLTLSTPLLALAYEHWTARLRFRRRAFLALASYGVVVHALGALLFEQPRLALSPWSTWDPGGIIEARPAASAAVALCALVSIATVLRLAHEESAVDDSAAGVQPLGASASRST